MPFGLKNAAQTFQCLMDRIFRGLPFVFIYLDDVLVASRTRKLHIEHLRVVLELLVQNGLVLNLDKCSFVQHEIEYLPPTHMWVQLYSRKSQVVGAP